MTAACSRPLRKLCCGGPARAICGRADNRRRCNRRWHEIRRCGPSPLSGTPAWNPSRNRKRRTAAATKVLGAKSVAMASASKRLGQSCASARYRHVTSPMPGSARGAVTSPIYPAGTLMSLSLTIRIGWRASRARSISEPTFRLGAGVVHKHRAGCARRGIRASAAPLPRAPDRPARRIPNRISNSGYCWIAWVRIAS